MTKRIAGQIKEIGGRIEQFAGKKIREKVMEGGEKAASSSDAVKVALWTKEAMDRLDTLTSTATRNEIMLTCGYNCIALNSRPLQMAESRRRKYPTEEAFLKAEVKKPPKGMRFEREGDILIQYYTPHTFSRGMRCYCSLMRGLPENIKASPTYCRCSLGFVQKYWEGILGRPVKVELGETAISGAEECKFIIHM